MIKIAFGCVFKTSINFKEVLDLTVRFQFAQDAVGYHQYLQTYKSTHRFLHAWMINEVIWSDKIEYNLEDNFSLGDNIQPFFDFREVQNTHQWIKCGCLTKAFPYSPYSMVLNKISLVFRLTTENRLGSFRTVLQKSPTSRFDLEYLPN